MLSKTRYIAGLQCAKRLWYEVNAFREIPPFDAAAEERFEQGHEVGRLACRLFPGGVEIARDKRRWSTTAAATLRAMPAWIPLYEAAFVHGGGACRVDILAPVEGGQWDLLEVKSSTSVKDVHRADLAFQTWVVRGAGVPVRRSSLHMRMVSAPLRKISSIGIHSKSGRISATLRAKKDSIQKKMKSVIAIKQARNSQATGEEKNSSTSFCATLRATRLRIIAVHLKEYVFQPAYYRL